MKFSVCVLRPSVEHNAQKLLLIRSLQMSVMLPIPNLVRYWQQHGLTMGDIALLQALFAAAVVMAELPTGYLADLIGRRRALIAGAAVLLVGETIYAMAGGFTQFLIAEIWLAVGFALISGADEALFYDSLVAQKRELEFRHLWGRTIAWEIGVGALLFVLGSSLALIGPRVPFFAALPPYAAALFFAVRLVEPERRTATRNGGHLSEVWQISRHLLIENRRTRWVILVTALCGASSQVGFWLYQPYFELCEIQLGWNGIILAAANLGASVFAYLAHRFDGRFGLLRSTFLVTGMTAGTYFLLAGFVEWWSPVFLLLVQGGRGLSGVVFPSALNAEVRSEYRATSISLCRLCNRGLYAVALIPAGWMVDSVGLLKTFGWLGWASLLSGLLAALLRPRN